MLSAMAVVASPVALLAAWGLGFSVRYTALGMGGLASILYGISYAMRRLLPSCIPGVMKSGDIYVVTLRPGDVISLAIGDKTTEWKYSPRP